MEGLNARAGGDQNRAPSILALTWVECSASIILVALRMFTRTRVTRHVGLDDLLIMITLVLIVTVSAIWTVYAKHGGCRHIYYLSGAQQSQLLKLNWMSQPFCIMAIATGKVSVAFLILRVLGVASKVKRNLLYVLIGSVLVVGIVNCSLIFAQCSPTRALWTPSMASAARCWSPNILTDFAICAGSYMAVVDLVLALFPVSIIWKLQITRRKKGLLGAYLGLGVFAAVCAAIKTTKLRDDSAREDFTWATVTLFVWNINEINVIIIAACIPTLPPLFKALGFGAQAQRYKRSKYVHPAEEGTSTELNRIRKDRDRSYKAEEGYQAAGAIRRTIDLDITSVPVNHYWV